MTTESKKMDKCRVQITATLDADEAKACVKEVEKQFMREARIPGFRQGKAPIELIRKDFSEQLKNEINREAFNKHHLAAVKDTKLEALGITEVSAIACTAEGGTFTFTIEVEPEFKLPTYKGLKISEKDTKVEDAAVKDQVEQLRLAYATYDAAKEGDVVGEGDFAEIDYEGTVDGKSILEIAPEAKVVASGKGFWAQVLEGRFLKEILDALKGMKAGETKSDIKVTFDKKAAPDALKGKKALYTVTLKSLKKRVLPTDEEFAKKAKSESIEALTKTIREEMEKQAIAAEATRRENEALEMLLKKVDFEVPQTYVQRATDQNLQNFAERAQYAGIPAEYFEKNRDKIIKEAEESAERNVRLHFLLKAIAKAEKIECKEEEMPAKVIEFILANAKK